MTIKKFLTTPEEMLALKYTDTKIYSEGVNGYYQFVQGVLCYFHEDGSVGVYTEIDMGKGFSNRYILVEEPVKEADKNDIGKLCKFWSDNPRAYIVGILCDVDFEEGGDCPYCMEGSYSCGYEHCRPLSPTEIAEITGYKVEEV